MDLTNRVALVTGGARRVGREIALQLAHSGCHVLITYRCSQDEANEVVDEIKALGRAAWAFQVDLGDAHVVEQVRTEVRSRTNRLDILVNNASVFEPTRWGKLSARMWHHHMTVNAMNPILITQSLRDMLSVDGGRVINIVDTQVGGNARKDYTAYNASKAALLEATQSLALEMAPGVTVNAVSPGAVAWAEGMSEEEQTEYLARVPLGKCGSPEDVAKAVLFLVRDAPYLTGETIRVDGGRWLS